MPTGPEGKPWDFESSLHSIIESIDARRDPLRPIRLQVVNHDHSEVFESHFLDSLVRSYYLDRLLRRWRPSVIESPTNFAKAMTRLARWFAEEKTTLIEIEIPHRDDRHWQPLRTTDPATKLLVFILSNETHPLAYEASEGYDSRSPLTEINPEERRVYLEAVRPLLRGLQRTRSD